MGLVVRAAVVPLLAEVVVWARATLVSGTFDGESIAGITDDTRMHDLAQALGLGWAAFVAAAYAIQALAMRTMFPGCTALGGRLDCAAAFAGAFSRTSLQ
ncbi:hypothetical protein MHU86_11279 [Fragilaria crotonensis]|nr:hypothetical protein MHU86_11279 [Fragilaria crotonensis]